MKDVNNFLRDELMNGRDISEYSIEMYFPASEMAKEILWENKVRSLIINDTPGLNSDNLSRTVEEANLLIFMLRDEDKKETEDSFNKILKDLKKYAATTHVLFLYAMRDACYGEEDYRQAAIGAQRGMEAFEGVFETLRNDSIIDTQIEIINPSANVLPLPAFSATKIVPSESLFTEDLKNSVNSIIKTAPYEAAEAALIDFLKEREDKNDIIDFTENILKDIDEGALNFLNISSEEFQNYDFKKRKHNRVKTGDYYKLLNAANQTRHNFLAKLYDKCREYKLNDYSEWQQLVIKYIYSMLSEFIKRDKGIGYGTHPFEDRPSTTMHIIEAILSPEILKVIDSGNDKSFLYRQIMKDSGILSDSWAYTFVDAADEVALKKLEVVSRCGLCDTNRSSLVDTTDEHLVRVRYTYGLYKLAQYFIWVTILNGQGTEKDEVDKESMQKIKIV